VYLVLNGGVSKATSETDRSSLATFIVTGASIVPHPALALNINYTETNTDQSGGGRGDTTSYSRRGDFSVSFNPFKTLYIFASFGLDAQTDRETITTQNYSLTWSPFQDGDLVFNLALNESISSDNTRDKTISQPGMVLETNCPTARCLL
jgi:hypothetical protein